MNKKQVGKYTIEEPTVGTLFPIMGLMESDPQLFQMKLAAACVYGSDGEPLGEEGVKALGIKEYMGLMTELMEVAGFSDPK